MKANKINNKLVWMAGFTGSASYLVFAIIAYLLYPISYNPIDNWLSDLGNPLVNTNGALLYNLGCIIAGLSLIVFSLGLRIWDNGEKKRGVLLAIAQVSNIISAISLIITALFPLGVQTQVHEVSGKIHIIFAGFFLTFSATILLRLLKTLKLLAIFGLVSAAINFIYGAFLYAVFILEWFAIGMFILYVILISIHSLRYDGSKDL